MSLFNKKKPFVSRRGIHFDLKGMPPTPRRHLELLELMGQSRLNLALVEWEDTFCWSAFPELRNETAFSERNVRSFLNRAAELDIAVIPLVQCLGHMENVLIRPRFRSLREVHDVPGDLCPLKPLGREIVKLMIDDVLRMHGSKITHFHLGGDEAGTLGSCPDCRKFVSANGKAALFIQHVAPLLEHLNDKGIRPILWDDMMRGWSMADLRRIASKTDLMVWSYGADIYDQIKPGTLDRYAKAGATVWGAPCFKGDKLATDLTDHAPRIRNILAWVSEAERRPLAGIVATGWGRYSTLMAPSETIETALDMIVLSGAALWDGELSDDALKEALIFLHSGKCGRLAGKKFARCVKVASDLRDWRQNVIRSLDWADCQSQFAGEPERINERYLSRKGFDDLLKDGEIAGASFIATHNGLIPKVWLERYVQSRIIPLRRRINAIYPA